jgi:CheY-like chemotaxis protein
MILIVDDVEANLFALEAALSALERPVIWARSGTQALSQLLKHDFALVLLDVQMPDMDGYETARWIRSTQRTRDLPIIFLTAQDRDDEGVKRAYQLGAVDFLFKPLDTEILQAKARVFITLHERTQELARLQARRLLDDQREEFSDARSLPSSALGSSSHSSTNSSPSLIAGRPSSLQRSRTSCATRWRRSAAGSISFAKRRMRSPPGRSWMFSTGRWFA